MITKWIEFQVAEESIEFFAKVMAGLESESKVEQGCVLYAVYQSKDDSSLFTVLESWASAEDLEAHRQAPHLKAFKSSCGDMILNKRALELDSITKEK
ncbi:Antibiotic biosynthesis monooxygenase [Lentisphaera araneosa HTCC2155]|uniref:Antibiotic biosynthesis monooxygenase n=1 Tax=Lentisphaera araneosa HTCC2155 TaxID=313628 RepID=A6DNZ5_9BACT|nr:putative quinol monooxygenase [Lentisphaera araneosa]EDM26527.1 Antibiotic biosynthesis monooxygenase [Lentisphaera araneosa HTCC2155]